MANTIKLKRGTSTPSTSDIASGEVAIDTSAKKLYVNDSGTVKEIGGGGGVTSDAQYNTVAGTNAGDSFDGTNAIKNTLFGYNAGTAIENGDVNTLIGFDAGKAMNSGSYNTAVGAEALIGCTTGERNSAFGEGAATGLTSGTYNQIFGPWSGWKLTTGTWNATLGYQAMRGDSANVTGDYNTIIGNKAAFGITTGSSNTCLGYQSGDALTTGSNNLVLGYNAAASAVDVSNEVTIGDTNITKFRVPGLNFVVKDSTATEDYVLTVDANGEAGWEEASGGGATGGGSDKIFQENGQTVTTNYTIGTTLGAACNALSAGPITINNSITVTIDSGDVWTIV
tara:strand:- start:475 stop:1491 length:1017 start_codon:yes stop_codon:yes gene_type:complete